jgi:hypothetical protein
MLRASTTSVFGHPDPPRTYLFHLDSSGDVYTGNDTNCRSPSAVLMIAYTAHCVAGQILESDSSTETSSPKTPSNTPFTICSLRPQLPEENDEDDMELDRSLEYAFLLGEVVTCLTVVGATPANPKTADSSVESLSRAIPSTSASSSPDVDCRLLALLLGTSASRVLAVELTLRREQDVWSLTLAAQERQHSDQVLFEALPRDDLETCRRLERSGNFRVPFVPDGGVVSLTAFSLGATTTTTSSGRHSSFVWVVYGDGTLVRVHSQAVFPSTWQQGAAANQSVEAWLGGTPTSKMTTTGRTAVSINGKRVLARCHVQMPPSVAGSLRVVPLYQYHLTPLAEVPGTVQSQTVESSSDDDADDDGENVDELESFEALVFSERATDNFPTLVFYTSENHFDHSMHPSQRSSLSQRTSVKAVVGNTKALVGGFVGSAMGALRWGWGGDTRAATHMSTPPVLDDEMTGDERDLPATPFPSLWKGPITLVAGHELHDAPRRIEFCALDPKGNLAALADTLGRIIVLDLTTKQVVRVWKGFREATCHWIQAPRAEDPGKCRLYLAIHSRQRRALEVWPIRQGGKVFSMQVGRDAHILPCTNGLSPSHWAICYCLYSNVIGTGLNRMERITVDGLSNKKSSVVTAPSMASSSTSTHNVAPSPSQTVWSPRTAALKLRHLQQLLSTESAHYTTQDLYKALQDIESLVDLSSALDLLAGASVLEDRLGVKGADFQKLALGYCSVTLSAATKGNDATKSSNPNVQLLSRKINFYSQIITAFVLVQKFEATTHDKASESQPLVPSTWAEEAAGWASTYSQIVDNKESSQQDSTPYHKSPVSFSIFAKALIFPNSATEGKKKMKIFFSDSSRTRKDILVHVFKPLLADVFSFNVVNSIFDALGIRDETDYIMKCFGEWFMTVHVDQILERCLFANLAPSTRLLQDLATVQLTKYQGGAALNVLYKFCKEATDLVRAFLLCVLCRDAVAKASTQQEKATYGTILSVDMTKDWECLLRSVRICLLVSLRLKGVRLGAAPVSVYAVEQDGNFSVYEWLARDELSLTQDHEEISSLEKACKMSSFAFDPSQREGDDPIHFKLLQSSCLSASISEDERAEYLVDFDDDMGALLLFFRRYNEPALLVAHRALLLGSKWSADPTQLATLGDVIAALKAMDKRAEFVSLAFAVKMEVWYNQICPIYRAYLFGFDEVHELNEQLVSPLIASKSWLSAFGHLALQLLVLLAEIPWDAELMSVYNPPLESGIVETWPPVKPDCIFVRLVSKCRRIDTGAWDAHCVVMCGLLVSSDASCLTDGECISGLYDLFIPQSLSCPTSISANATPQQRIFLQTAVAGLATEYSGRAMDSFACLVEVEMLGKIWGFDLKFLRSLYLLAMYELAKDRMVDELLTKSATVIDGPYFVEGAVDIVCRRLNDFLFGDRMRTGEIQGVVGMLDADLCEWLQSRAESSSYFVKPGPPSSIRIGNTHLFTMRLLSLSATAQIEPALRVKIHSLVVLSGTLVKALEGRK